MADDSRFCVRCGAIIPDGSSFCGECGLSLNQDAPYDAPPESRRVSSDAKGLGAVPICILLYGIIMTALSLFALYILVDFDNIIAYFRTVAEQLSGQQKQQMLDLIEQMVTLYTPDARAFTAVLSSLLLVSSLAAVVSGYLANRQERWKLSLILCAAATALSIVTLSYIAIILVIVGAFMTYRIYQSKDIFKS